MNIIKRFLLGFTTGLGFAIAFIIVIWLASIYNQRNFNTKVYYEGSRVEFLKKIISESPNKSNDICSKIIGVWEGSSINDDGTIKKSWVQEVHADGRFSSKKIFSKIESRTVEESEGTWKCKSPIFSVFMTKEGHENQYTSLVLNITDSEFSYAILGDYSIDGIFNSKRRTNDDNK